MAKDPKSKKQQPYLENVPVWIYKKRTVIYMPYTTAHKKQARLYTWEMLREYTALIKKQGLE